MMLFLRRSWVLDAVQSSEEGSSGTRSFLVWLKKATIEEDHRVFSFFFG
jgi:hypothetical protein